MKSLNVLSIDLSKNSSGLTICKIKEDNKTGKKEWNFKDCKFLALINDNKKVPKKNLEKFLLEDFKPIIKFYDGMYLSFGLFFEEFLKDEKIEHVIIEGHSFGSFRNSSSVTHLTELHGILKYICLKLGIPFEICSPRSHLTKDKSFMFVNDLLKKNRFKTVEKNYKPFEDVCDSITMLEWMTKKEDS